MSKIEIQILVSIWPCNSRSVTAAKVSICRVDTGTTFHLPLHIEIAITDAISPFYNSLHKNLAAMLDWLQFLIITCSRRFQILQSYMYSSTKCPLALLLLICVSPHKKSPDAKVFSKLLLWKSFPCIFVLCFPPRICDFWNWLCLGITRENYWRHIISSMTCSKQLIRLNQSFTCLKFP